MFSAIIFSLLATVAWYFFLPIGTPVQNLVAWQIRLVAPLVTVVAVAAGAASIAPPSRFADPPWRIYSRLGLSGFLAFACLIALVVAPGDPVKRLFLFLRTADLGSKVSPLVPMLLTYAAAIALSLGALRRQALIESRQVLTPLLDFGTESFSGVADLERRVRELVGTGAWPWRTYISVGVPIALTYGFALPFRQFSHSHVDTVTFKGLFCIVSLAVYTGICLAIVKMVSVWLSVRKLLRRIYTHPSRGGYAAYRQQLHFIKQPAIDLLSKVPAMSQLEVALEQVRQLLITSDDPGTRASAEIEKRLDQERPWLGLLLPWAEQSINETEEAEATGDWSESILKKRRTEIWMAFLSRSIAYIFEPLWRTINPSRLPSNGHSFERIEPNRHNRRNLRREPGRRFPATGDAAIGDARIDYDVGDALDAVRRQLVSIPCARQSALVQLVCCVGRGRLDDVDVLFAQSRPRCEHDRWNYAWADRLEFHAWCFKSPPTR